MHWMALLIHPDCGYPKWPVAIMIPQNLFMMALFGDFYYKTYVKKMKKPPVVAFANTSVENHTNDKIHTNGDIRYRHTNGTTHMNDMAKNGHSNGCYSNGIASTNGSVNGNVVRHINEMS